MDLQREPKTPCIDPSMHVFYNTRINYKSICEKSCTIFIFSDLTIDLFLKYLIRLLLTFESISLKVIEIFIAIS